MSALWNKDLKAALRRRHTAYGGEIDGVLVFEMPTGTGYAHGEPNRIDAFFMACRPSENLRRVAYEIKIARADFLRELAQPLKRRAALRVSNQYYFVTPPQLAKPEEIPLDCGLLELQDERLVEVVAAPFRDGEPASWHFFAAFARRVMKLEPQSPAPAAAPLDPACPECRGTLGHYATCPTRLEKPKR